MNSPIHTLYRTFKMWRQRRAEWFVQRVKPKATDLLLDVGGYPGFWTSMPQIPKRIDTLNISPIDWDARTAPGYDIRMLVGDGCALNFPDNAYDIIFSNSVIEHVGSWEKQRAFAAEVRRVGRSLWVQTPAYECPIEPHFIAPFIHYLPRFWQKRLARWLTVWGWLLRPSDKQIAELVDSTRLLRLSEMKELFPDCEIVIERILGVIPKSYVAVRVSPRPLVDQSLRAGETDGSNVTMAP